MKRLQRFKELVQTDLKRLWRAGAVHITSSQWIVNVLNILQRILLARILGAANIGHIAVIKSTYELLMLPANAGMPTSITKFTAEMNGNKKDQNHILSVSFWFVLLISTVVALIGFILFKYTGVIADAIDKRSLSVLVLLLPVVSLYAVLRSWITGRKEMHTVAKFETIIPVIVIIVAVVFSLLLGLNGWIISYACFLSIGFFLYFVRTRQSIHFVLDSDTLKRMLKIGLFAFFGQGVGLVLLRFDTLCISGIIKDPELTGIYNVAAIASQQMMIVVNGILFTVFPNVAENRNDITTLQKKYKELSIKLFIMSVAAGGLALVFAPFFFKLFGEKFALSTAPFSILLISYLFRVQYVLANTYLDALGRTDITFASGLFAMAANIALNFILIPKWGINGAAWATVISFGFSMLLRETALHYVVFYKKRVR